MATYELTEGWTAVIDIDLLSRGASPSGDLTGMTAALIITDRRGNVVNTTGDVSIPDTEVWRVRYAPDSTDITPGTYQMRVKITDNGGLVSYFPSGEADKLIVYPNNEQ